jgi:hypothetical protein
MVGTNRQRAGTLIGASGVRRNTVPEDSNYSLCTALMAERNVFIHSFPGLELCLYLLIWVSESLLSMHLLQ